MTLIAEDVGTWGADLETVHGWKTDDDFEDVTMAHRNQGEDHKVAYRRDDRDGAPSQAVA